MLFAFTTQAGQMDNCVWLRKNNEPPIEDYNVINNVNDDNTNNDENNINDKNYNIVDQADAININDQQ